jgi:Sec-independent protein secretion pathway component TatC
MYLLYEGGILMARIMTRGRDAAASEKISDG